MGVDRHLTADRPLGRCPTLGASLVPIAKPRLTMAEAVALDKAGATVFEPGGCVAPPRLCGRSVFELLPVDEDWPARLPKGREATIAGHARQRGFRSSMTTFES
jgi:hypothetical protein